MLDRSRSRNVGFFTQELQHAATSSPAVDRDLGVRIGKCIAVRRDFCGLSKQQLGARLGIDPVEVEAYEEGEKRMSCRLLLETAKQLKAAPRFFFQ
jgi:ribosome-binding protein aMBF1 (putative translation factor)